MMFFNLFFLGLMTRTCKSTRRHALEMMNNVALLREAHHHLMNPEMDHRLVHLAQSWISRRCKHTADQPMYRVIHKSQQTDQAVCLAFNMTSVLFYSSAYIGLVRFTTWRYACGKATDDSHIVFRSDKRNLFGRISHIFTISNSVEPMFKVQTLSQPTSLEYFIDEDTVADFDEIQTGHLNEENYRFVRPTDILEKCVSFYHRTNKTWSIMKFPNLEESS